MTPTVITRPETLVALAAGFETASKSSLEALALQRRFDRKFLLRAHDAPELLTRVRDEYRVVLAGGERFALYDTTYFDTPDLRCFHDHRRKRRPRVKIRVRHYADRGLTMLEVKQKTASGATHKERWERPYGLDALGEEEFALLRPVCPATLPVEQLGPQARTVFYRLMLLGKRTAERVTLDFSVSFERAHTRRVLDGGVVVEVKDSGRAQDSPLVTALRSLRASGRTVSKYCAAVALIDRGRVNEFLPGLRALEGVLR